MRAAGLGGSGAASDVRGRRFGSPAPGLEHRTGAATRVLFLTAGFSISRPRENPPFILTAGPTQRHLNPDRLADTVLLNSTLMGPTVVYMLSRTAWCSGGGGARL